MTSELGCVTPWIVAPQKFTDKELEHQVKHLFASLFNNGGANCNSPKVVVLTKDWPQADAFTEQLKAEMSKAPLPVAYYPGSRDRWNAFRDAYPAALMINGTSSFEERSLTARATLLPWLVIDGIAVDLTSTEGCQRAMKEYAFRNEPFAPVVTLVTVDSLDDAVVLANDYMFGSLSCTVIAPDSSALDVERAISELKYGSIAVNTWSAQCYAFGCVWGAYPGEKLEQVESGIGGISNCWFLPRVEKSVLRTDIVDPSLQPIRKCNYPAARNEFRALFGLVMKPGVFSLLNLFFVVATGREFPSWTCVWKSIMYWVFPPSSYQLNKEKL